MPHVWMSHSWHMYECYMHGTCMNVTYSHMAHMWIRHGTCMNVTFISHVWMWHGTYVNKACHWTKAPEFTDVKDLAAASVPVKPHVCIRHGTYMNDSWHVYECGYLIPYVNEATSFFACYLVDIQVRQPYSNTYMNEPTALPDTGWRRPIGCLK